MGIRFKIHVLLLLSLVVFLQPITLFSFLLCLYFILIEVIYMREFYTNLYVHRLVETSSLHRTSEIIQLTVCLPAIPVETKSLIYIKLMNNYAKMKLILEEFEIPQEQFIHWSQQIERLFEGENRFTYYTQSPYVNKEKNNASGTLVNHYYYLLRDSPNSS